MLHLVKDEPFVTGKCWIMNATFGRMFSRLLTAVGRLLGGTAAQVAD